ncbi:MAG: HAD family hydrolase [Aestuariivirga sp.]
MPDIEWNEIDLVVFDVDGTLYDQKRLRAIMAFRLLIAAIRSRSFETVRILRIYRKVREDLGEDSSGNFMERQFELTAAKSGLSVVQIKTVIREWMEKIPLQYLAKCRYPGVLELFETLHQSGRKIAIFSDYALDDKLEALGLRADILVSAEDPDVQKLKPHPKGLLKVLKAADQLAGRSLMVGDRFDRDLAVATNAGMKALILSKKADPRCPTFKSYRDVVFVSLKQLSYSSASGAGRFTLEGNDAARF